MRRILIMVIVLLFAVPSGCSSKNKIEDIFESFTPETSETTPYVQHSTFIYDDVVLDFNALLAENSIDGDFHEVYGIQDNIIYFGYSEKQSNSGSGQVWHIGTITIGQEKCKSVFSAVFCADGEADQHYIPNSNSHSPDRYTKANGFYHDKKIVLTDHSKLTEFDIMTGSAKEFDVQSYNYPTMPVVEIIDCQTIRFSKNVQEKTFGVNEGTKSSAVFEKMMELSKEKIWNGDSLLSDLFNKVQIVDNQIYIICRVMNWNGETHAVVYRYNFETNSCQHAFHCFMDDLITNNLYVVPLIS